MNKQTNYSPIYKMWRMVCWTVQSPSVLVTIMVHSIEIFRWIQNIHRMTGIYPTSTSKQNSLSNCKKVIVLMSLAFYFVTSTAFALLEARTPAEYATSSSTSIMMFINFVLLLINWWKMKNIIELIRKYEDFIEMSKHSEVFFGVEINSSLLFWIQIRKG